MNDGTLYQMIDNAVPSAGFDALRESVYGGSIVNMSNGIRHHMLNSASHLRDQIALIPIYAPMFYRSNVNLCWIIIASFGICGMIMAGIWLYTRHIEAQHKLMDQMMEIFADRLEECADVIEGQSQVIKTQEEELAESLETISARDSSIILAYGRIMEFEAAIRGRDEQLQRKEEEKCNMYREKEAVSDALAESEERRDAPEPSLVDEVEGRAADAAEAQVVLETMEEKIDAQQSKIATLQEQHNTTSAESSKANRRADELQVMLLDQASVQVSLLEEGRVAIAVHSALEN